MAAGDAAAPAPVRWGIIGTANIARKNVLSIRGAENAALCAVASRDVGRAREWAKENGGIPKAYGSYEELLADAEIDAVYIPLPTGVRKQWVLAAAKAGKHILCEKPVAKSAGEFVEMIDACKRSGVALMDGVMFMHNPRLAEMREELDKWAAAGTPANRVVSSFSFAGDDAFHGSNIRVAKELEPLGCLGDLGWYNIRFTLWALDWVLPTRALMVVNEHSSDGVPTDVACVLQWDAAAGAPRCTATFDCSFHHTLRQAAEVSATHAALSVDDFVIPQSTDLVYYETSSMAPTDRAVTFVRRSQRHAVAGRACNQHVAMVEQLSALAVAARGAPRAQAATPGTGADRREFWMDIALKTQKVADALMASGSAPGGGGKWVEVGK